MKMSAIIKKNFDGSIWTPDYQAIGITFNIKEYYSIILKQVETFKKDDVVLEGHTIQYFNSAVEYGSLHSHSQMSLDNINKIIQYLIDYYAKDEI